MSERQSRDKLRAEYEALQPKAMKFCAELERELNAVVKNSEIVLAFPVEARVKSWDSVVSKIERLSMNLRSLTEMQDVVGARVIVLFPRDAEQLCRSISETFSVLRAEDTGDRLKDDRFGYLSMHFVVRLPEHWVCLPSLANIGDLSAEIQVRTASQHIWAAASHYLQYRNEASVPSAIRRSIHRVSALLETVDLELNRVLTEREEYRRLLNLDSSEPLNVDSLEKLLDSLLPAKNKGKSENYAVLLKELADFHIYTVEDLKRFVGKHLRPVLEEDLRRAREHPHKEKLTGHERERILEKGVFFLHVGLTRAALQREFGKRWDDYMMKLALKYMAKDDPRRPTLKKIVLEG